MFPQEPHVNTCYKHFYYFIREFDLVSTRELEPLQEMTSRICHDPTPPPESIIPSSGCEQTGSQ